MATSIRIDDDLYEQAKKAARIHIRTIAGQVEFWARVGKASLDNPDVPVSFVHDLILARAEDPIEPFIPEGKRD